MSPTHGVSASAELDGPSYPATSFCGTVHIYALLLDTIAAGILISLTETTCMNI